MTTFSLREAADEARVSKSTIWRAVRSGRISAARTDDGGFAIDPSELHRVFPLQHAENANAGHDATPLMTNETALRSAETVALERENKLLREAVEDLRKALALADRLSLAAPTVIATPGPVAPAEPKPRRSLLRYWFGWRAAG